MMENHQHQKFLPDEIILNILSRLSADSTIRFKRVCKAWRSIIEENPGFHYMNLNDDHATSTTMGFVVMERVRYSSIVHYVQFVEYKHIDHSQEVIRLKRWKLPVLEEDHSSKTRQILLIVGSCNGLICISNIPDCCDDINRSQHTMLVCNPLTAEVVNLSNSNTSTTTTHDDELVSSSSLSLVGIGFGYLPSTNEYKVVRMYSADTTEERRIKHVQVYTLGGNGGRWRSIVPQRSSSSSWSDISFRNGRWKTIDPQRRSSWPDDSFWSRATDADPIFKLGVSVNGALYFNNHMNIVSFDLAKEEFRMIVPPEPPTHITNYIGDLGVLGGCLCATTYRFLLRHNSAITTTETDIWVMEKEKDDQEEEESWIKICTLPSEITKTFLGYIPLGGALALPRIVLQPKWEKEIISYNPETRKSCCRHIPGNWGKINVIPYTKSCVSLKALGENTLTSFFHRSPTYMCWEFNSGNREIRQ